MDTASSGDEADKTFNIMQKEEFYFLFLCYVLRDVKIRVIMWISKHVETRTQIWYKGMCAVEQILISVR